MVTRILKGKVKASQPATVLTAQHLLLNFLEKRRHTPQEEADAAARVEETATPGHLGGRADNVRVLFANLEFILLRYSINISSWYLF